MLCLRNVPNSAVLLLAFTTACTSALRSKPAIPAPPSLQAGAETDPPADQESQLHYPMRKLEAAGFWMASGLVLGLLGATYALRALSNGSTPEESVVILAVLVGIPVAVGTIAALVCLLDFAVSSLRVAVRRATRDLPARETSVECKRSAPDILEAFNRAPRQEFAACLSSADHIEGHGTFNADIGRDGSVRVSPNGEESALATACIHSLILGMRLLPTAGNACQARLAYGYRASGSAFVIRNLSTGTTDM